MVKGAKQRIRAQLHNQKEIHKVRQATGGKVVENDLEVDKVLQHWFLLEKELVQGIMKGNRRLLPAALARIRYLQQVIAPDLLAEGLKGEEEALWSIHEFLHNNGWWERAKNLVISKGVLKSQSREDSLLYQFILDNQKLVHENVMKMVERREQEGIRMALNQIHYGSIMEANQRKALMREEGLMREKLLKEKLLATKARGINATSESASPDHNKVLDEFLQNYKNLIEPSVYIDARNGHDKAVSLALGQIHHKTLPGENSEVGTGRKSYKEALITGDIARKPSFKVGQINSHISSTSQEQSTVFFTGIEDSSKVKDLWQFFKKEGKFKDIILPRRRDRFGNRIGFLVMIDKGEAVNMIKKLNGKLYGAKRLYLTMAKSRGQLPQSRANGRFSKSSQFQGDRENKNTRQETNQNCKKEKVTGNKVPDQDNGESLEDNAAKEKKENDLSEKSVINLQSNNELAHELETCLILHTVKAETTQNVEMIVEGLGFEGVQIRGLAETKFLAHFSLEESVRNIDMDFLHIGFKEVREVRTEDLIPSRKAWIELRGLPILGWTKENFSLIIGDMGHIMQYCKSYDEEGTYQTPKLLISTNSIDNIDEGKLINLHGRNWKIRIIETSGQENDLHLTSITDEFDNNDHCPEIQKREVSKEGKVEHFDSKSSENKEASDRISEVQNASPSNSLVNPETPHDMRNKNQSCEAEGVRFEDQSCEDIEEVQEEIISNLNNWKPREKDSSISNLRSLSQNRDGSVEENLSVDDNPQEEQEELPLCYALHPNILKDMHNLKVQRKRGRPRKLNPKLVNKHFRVPKRKKKKGEGLQQISHFFLNNNHDEAEAIFESGVLMGLMPVNSREKSLNLIRENLAL